MERDGEIKGLEAAWTRRDGSVIFVRESARVVRDESGNVLWYDGIVEDITERKLMEKNLEKRTAYLNALIENSPLAIVAVDANECVQMCNPAFERLFQYRLEEIVGTLLNELIAPPDLLAEANNYSQRAAAGENVMGATRRRRKDGTMVDVEIHGVPLMDQGSYLGTFGLYQDITERRKAESEKGRLVTAIEQSAEGVVITNTAGDIEYINPAFTRITGYSREEVLGHNPRILKSDKQDPAFYQQLWATILKGEIWHGELINRRKDGSLYTEQMSIAPVRNTIGEVTHFIATIRDVT
jgi:sigma-B regulation protein RsbU (phosphoserine phosphatase)